MPAPARPIVRISHLAKGYRRGGQAVPVLFDITLTIPEGDFIALMGPSGSGKSTLLNLVSGIDRPSEGDVFVVGERLNDLSEDELAHWRARHVGLIFQFFNLMPVLTARDNVALPLLLTRLDKRERLRRAETALRVVGLAHRLDHYPRTLSGGEQHSAGDERSIATSSCARISPSASRSAAPQAGAGPEKIPVIARSTSAWVSLPSASQSTTHRPRLRARPTVVSISANKPS